MTCGEKEASFCLILLPFKVKLRVKKLRWSRNRFSCVCIRIFQRLFYIVSREPLRRKQITLKEYVNRRAGRKCTVGCERSVMEICRLKADGINASLWPEWNLANANQLFSLLHLSSLNWLRIGHFVKRAFLHVEISTLRKTITLDGFQARAWIINFFSPPEEEDGQFSPAALIDLCLARWCAYSLQAEVRTSSKCLGFCKRLQHFCTLWRGVWCQSQDDVIPQSPRLWSFAFPSGSSHISSCWATF